VAANEYVVGQFLWTGVDYLGEAHRYPSRGNGAGLLDICGFLKPDAYLREALWTDRLASHTLQARPVHRNGCEDMQLQGGYRSLLES
jgi:beta-galactosidase